MSTCDCTVYSEGQGRSRVARGVPAISAHGSVCDGGTAVPLTRKSKLLTPEPASVATALSPPPARFQPPAISEPPATIFGGVRSSSVRSMERIQLRA